MRLKNVHLKEFLAAQNIGRVERLPWFHSTKGTNLMDILNAGKLKALPCNVFQDKLSYFFVGRPAYKYTTDGDPAAWMLPVVFVFDFKQPPPIKRIYPFDSGAFTERRLPDYIHTFDREHFLLGSDAKSIDKLVALYFGDRGSYVRRQANSQRELQRRHTFDMRHSELMALARLYSEQIMPEMDDRAAAVEVQVAADVPLGGGNLRGVIVCQEWLRTPGIRKELTKLTPNVLDYPIYPNTMQAYFGMVAQKTMDLYSALGIRI
ncbi:hypothetical protein ACXIUS_05610 [Bosea thiooxidans]|nr:hypothetical protein [Bosea sp. (in: a-proteobacteria)]